MSLFRRMTVFPLSLAVAVVALATGRAVGHDSGHSPAWKASPLVEKVRQATRRYRDVATAEAEGWVQGTPCVSGPNTGAMGVHFILPARIGDGELKADEPEALIYEPQPGGGMRLVGVEYIVIASDWANQHPEGGTPIVDGHLTHYVGEPNRYGLPAFYELHVWAWERNPQGNFSDWNTVVTCDKQSGD